ncbi:PREDICTED: plasma kallikrein-like, partial [Rhagoletis zephyria]|uniref:plasma kallikrein-like n=1 Tax=Rhagoletis zephyria TaxID=28612 RepID=UPI00081120F0
AYNISSEAVTGNDSRKITIEIEKIIVHSEYSDSNAFINNIALVKLVAPVDVAGNPDLNTICVPTLRAHKIKKYGQRRVIPVNVAWEPNEKNDAKSELLQELGSTIVPNKDCMKKYNIDLKYKHQLYCMNACLGYDGGAVEFINHQPSDDKYPWTLLGIAFPKGSNPDNSCCVYTSVEYYSDWIWKTIQQNI